MRWMGHVAWLGEGRVAYRVFVGNCDGKKPFGRLGTKGRIILKWIFQLFWRMWPGVLWLRIGTSSRLL